MDRKIVILCPNFVRPFVVVPRVVVRVRKTVVGVVRCNRRLIVVVIVARLVDINDIFGSFGNVNDVRDALDGHRWLVTDGMLYHLRGQLPRGPRILDKVQVGVLLCPVQLLDLTLEVVAQALALLYAREGKRTF